MQMTEKWAIINKMMCKFIILAGGKCKSVGRSQKGQKRYDPERQFRGKGAVIFRFWVLRVVIIVDLFPVYDAWAKRARGLEFYFSPCVARCLCYISGNSRLTLHAQVNDALFSALSGPDIRRMSLGWAGNICRGQRLRPGSSV